MDLPVSHQRMDSAVVHSHETFMKRALELAANGCGNVSPNPLVGCVVVHDGKIIGEGWHKQYGGPHAEVNAIGNVHDKNLLRESTVYVNLEPCSHTGKTPPCADMLVGMQIPTIVIANQDPNPKVAGNGIKRLRNAGATVIDDVLPGEGLALNKRFFTYMIKKRPHIILKWAETSDGFIARANHDSKWISDEYSRQIVHKWRSEEDAVMVASGTAQHDNPELNVRNWSGRDPVRVVIDRHLKLSTGLHLFDGSRKTICYNLKKEEFRPNLSYVRLGGQNLLGEVVDHLYEQQIQSIIVEGGAKLLTSFIEADLWDEARIFTSPQVFGTGIQAPVLNGHILEEKKLHNDWLKILEPRGS